MTKIAALLTVQLINIFNDDMIVDLNYSKMQQMIGGHQCHLLKASAHKPANATLRPRHCCMFLGV